MSLFRRNTGNDYSRPNPDPTTATEARIERGLRVERDLDMARLTAIMARLDAMDEANKVLHETVTRTPTDIQQAVGHLKELSDEQFRSIAKQFAERDTRSERESRDNKVAVDAAFAAQKEAAAKQDESNAKAIDKSEKATNDSINKLGDSATAANKALADKIDDLKARTGTLEASRLGFMQGADRVNSDGDRSFSRTEAKFTRVFQSIYLALAGLGIYVTLVASHVIK